MAVVVNFQKELDKIILNLENEGITPTLFLHSCCGPCSSYVLEYLSNYFEITVFYYNPNIYPSEEYFYRVKEQQQLIDLMETKNKVNLVTGKYDVSVFYNAIKGMEKQKEGDIRCRFCYEMRMKEAAHIGSKTGFDYFTTTLSISPYKNAVWINEIGQKLEKEYDIKFLPSDFKKKNGYQRSIELSKKFNMYRQDYCGCIFSLNERKEFELYSAIF